jgi:hypothetical protein
VSGAEHQSDRSPRPGAQGVGASIISDVRERHIAMPISAKTEGIMRKTIITLATAAALTLSGGVAAHAAPTITATKLTATVSGENVTVDAEVKASKKIRVSDYGVCARSEAGDNVDFDSKHRATISRGGKSFTATQSLPAGEYTYFACAYYNGSWWNGPTDTFTVDAGAVEAPETPAEEAPVEEAPVEEAPVEEAPVEEAPVEEAPAEEAPVEAAPVTSGSGLPVGNLPGWTQNLAEDFTTDAGLGAFQDTYANSWCGYEEGTGGQYFNNATISAHDGLMDIALDGTQGAAGSFGPPETCWGDTYGRYSIKFKAEDASGYGTAMMVWPSSDVWGDGEIDYPEGDFDGTFHAYQHPLGCSDCSSSVNADSNASFRDWHVATTEWSPEGVNYYVDDQLILATTDDNPNTDHRWTIQVAPVESNAQAGNLLIDWVSSYSYTP